MRGWSPTARDGVLLLLLALGLCAPSVATAYDVNTPAGHAAEDAVSHDRVTEERLDSSTRIHSATAAAVTAAAVAADPGQAGEWGPVVDWPVVGIHVALLPNGKVLAWDSVGDAATETFPIHDFTRATVYDPQTGTQTPANVDTGFNIFCAGFAHLFDGSLFIAGGNKDAQLNGIVQTHLFNPANNDWSLGPNMAAGRWYPSVTPLPNGEMLITEGGPDIPEVRTTDGNLRSLSTASLNLPLYPWMDVAPDGRVFYSGPDPTLRKLDPAGTGSWQSFGQRDAIDRGYGSHAVYDIGKTLVAGGGPSSSDARVIDTNGATPQVSATAPMAFGRRQHNLTLLADGSVLATGGNSTGASLIDMNGGVYNAERWDPATGQWTTLAAQAVTRQYHSTALLLPDGRVLSSGGGICGTCDAVGYLAKNAEIFTPAYLFMKDGSGRLAPRPEITDAPATISHGTAFQITTPNAASIRKVGLVRLGAQTHSVEMEQRYVPVSFTAGSGTLTATVPANVNAAIPGAYMLFIVDSAGVPSVARMLTVDAAAPPPPPPPPPPNQPPSVSLTSPANGAIFTSPAKLSLAANASDADGTVVRVEFFNGGTKLGEDTSAPYTVQWNVGASGTYALTARATDSGGAITTSSPVTITVRKRR
jgi:Galactose oxidase-like, Early set domain/Bacterial Ig domain